MRLLPADTATQIAGSLHHGSERKPFARYHRNSLNEGNERRFGADHLQSDSCSVHAVIQEKGSKGNLENDNSSWLGR